MGEASPSYQSDPLSAIFSDLYDKRLPEENAKLKKYQRFYSLGAELNGSCSQLKDLSYATILQQNVVRRSVVSTLQLIGLDAAVKSIGSYAKRLEVSPEDYQTLATNLVKNYCSQNLTVISLRNIEKSLQHYYATPDAAIIPALSSSPFASEASKVSTERVQARKREFDTALRSFRSFCSWGGDVEDYRMLAPYLRNPFIQGMLIDQLTTKDVAKNSSVKVLCRGLICRQVPAIEFNREIPVSVGSTGLDTDLKKQYCSHFRFLDYQPKRTLKEVAGWIKGSELEAPILEVNFFVSLLTGMPDLMFGIDKYNEAPALAKSSIDDRWNLWAKKALGTLAHDLYFEESLRVRAEPRRNPIDLRSNGFKINFSVTVGEIDRLMNDKDKISMRFEVKLPKNYLRSLRTKWNDMAMRTAFDEQPAFYSKEARTMEQYLKPKQDLFQQKMWNDEFGRLVSVELIEQVLKYEGPLFDSYQEEMIVVPITFSYGLFALNYLRYRADVQHGRLKVNL